MSRRDEIAEKMKQIVGEENVVTDKEVLEDATHDRGIIRYTRIRCQQQLYL